MDKPTLRFRPDGTFRILQLTDMHFRYLTGRNVTTLALIRTLLEREQPDLVALTGDISCNGGIGHMTRLFARINDIFESFGVPYTFVMGNHENDPDDVPVGRQHLLADALEALPLSLFERGPAELGVGNYAVPILPHTGEDRPAWMLYHLDGHSNAMYPMADGSTVRSDAAIRPAQIAWLEQTHTALQAAQGAVPSLVFDHIPLPEFDELWMFDGIQGYRGERVCHPPVNTGLFSVLYRLKDFRGVFVGHDHTNCYSGEMFGILLAYGLCSGYQPTCQTGFKRGGRMIVLDEATGQIARTYLTLHDGSEPDNTWTPPFCKRKEFFLPPRQ